MSALVVAGLLSSSMLSLASPSKVHQRGGSHGGGGGGSHGGGGGGGSHGGGGQRGGGNQSRSTQQNRPAPVNHAQREVVRTPNFVQRNSNGNFAPRTSSSQAGDRHIISAPSQAASRRPVHVDSSRVVIQRRFTKTTQGRVYDNGLRLRKGIAVTAAWQHHYFPKGHYHFGFYRPTYVAGSCFLSVYGCYFGVCVPFISASDCHLFPPTVAFIDMPVYSGNVCNGFVDQNNPNLLNDANLDQDQPGLGNALDELTETYQSGDIDGLVSLIDPNTMIAVYLRGKYKYSLSANDYVDLTRDTLQSVQTVQFSLQYLHERSPGVFSAAGRHTYRDSSGATQTVWVSFVLQDISGQWTLTQVGTSPGVYHRLAP